MAFVITDKCIDCRYTTCVDVCPVDAFHAGENMLVINPSVCIDCSLCEDECPIEAIIPESTDHPKIDEFLEYADDKSAVWPVITAVEKPMLEAANNARILNKWDLRPLD